LVGLFSRRGCGPSQAGRTLMAEKR
jgi:hypothetical protein